MVGVEVIGAAVRRLAWTVRPRVTIGPPPEGVVLDHDVPVVVRDGTTLRVNVFRPAGRPCERRYPVLLSAHPYGKDALPGGVGRDGRRVRIPFQTRIMPQSQPFGFSAWTSWEAPDPGFWVPRGYVVVNCDLRGWGRSEGTPALLSDQEGRDGYDLVEWAGAQDWSNGRVGMCGVSYLAISQWAAAAARPPHLAAICPWEGFTDFYRDFARPGGVQEQGFLRVWGTMLHRKRPQIESLFDESRRRPLFDAWWAARDRDLEQISVPALVCGSFSDHNLHSRGSFEGFRRIRSGSKWLYTHRGPKWATFYGAEAQTFQARFFDHFLAGADNGMQAVPRVRVEVREDASRIVAVRGEEDWPPPGTTWQPLWLDPLTRQLARERPSASSSVGFDLRRGQAIFRLRFDQDSELVGPMTVDLHVAVAGADDACLFVGVEKVRDGRRVGFEGSYGFGEDMVTHGMRRASLRAVDPQRSLAWRPFHPDTRREPLKPGEVVRVPVALAPSATLFRAGEELRLVVRGRWFFARNPFTGAFPADYERSPRGRCTLYGGGEYASALHVPTRPEAGADGTDGSGRNGRA